MHDLSHWVRACRGRRVLLVGDLILDRYVYGDAERISPEAPVPVLRVVERREAVGGAANVAACLRALGVEVVCCGVVGEDRHARTLRGLLTDLGVSDQAVATLAARGLTEEVGRAPGPGRPVLFGTTVRFLEYFGLQRPEELPPLPQLEPAEAGEVQTLVPENLGTTEPQNLA